MDEKLIATFLEMYRLMHNYSMMWYRKNFGGIDPNQGQGRILSALSRKNNISQKELGTSLDIRPQSLGELLQKLEANDYIKRYRSPTDKRALIVELTAKGEEFQLQKPDYDFLFTDMAPEERAALTLSFEKMSKQLEELIEQELEDEYYYY